MTQTMPETSPTLDPFILERNLAALAQVDGDVHAVLLSACDRIPPARPALGRDGELTLRIAGADGSASWLGRASLPRVRANALLEQFNAGTGNVLLPGIAQGLEVVLLLQRLASHRAVFVWEEDPANLLLAMSVHDLSVGIRQGRVVLVIAAPKDLTGAMLECLERRPGHLCPDRIMMWPWHTLAGIAECRTSVEIAYQQTEQRRTAELYAAKHRLAASSAEVEPAAAVLSIHNTSDTDGLAGALVSAIGAAGWKVARATVRYPADVHPLARVQQLAHHLHGLPRFVLLLETCRADVAEVLPGQVPAVSWFSHAANLGSSLAGRVGPADRFLATDTRILDRLAEAGIDRERISIQPFPCLAPVGEPPPDWDDRPVDIAVLANLSPTDPASHGHDLPTHGKIWQAAVELIRGEVDSFRDIRIQAILEKAESRTGMRIEESHARRQIADLLAGPVATTLIWHHIAQILLQNGHTIAFWGHGWTGGRYAGPIPDLSGRLEVYRQAKCTIFANPSGTVPGDLLTAAGCGTAVAWRSHQGRDDQPGGLRSLLQPSREAVVFDRDSDVFKQIARFLADAQAWRKLVIASLERCRRDHAPSQAFAAIQAVAASLPASGTT